VKVRFFIGILIGILMTAVLLLPVGVPAAEVPVRLNLYEEGGVLTKRVKSMKEMRQRQMIPQTRDFSCGAASLATILHNYYGLPVTELETIIGMFKYGNQQDIKKVGFSLYDMKRYANSLKYAADGYKIPKVEDLKKLTIPVIALIDTANYKHFVVIRHVDDRFVYIADPSWGNRKIPLDEFKKIWNQNVIFAVQGPKVGKPEGLFAEKPASASQISTWLKEEPFFIPRFALDPADSILIVSNTPLVVIPFIPGQP
jgi:predicted double-glycine peptidase